MYTQIIIKKIYFFFFTVYKNNTNFNNKNIKKRDFYNKNKKIFNIGDIDANKILVSKKEQYIIHLNSLLGIMITMLLDHYTYFFHKLLDTLINLIKIK